MKSRKLLLLILLGITLALLYSPSAQAETSASGKIAPGMLIRIEDTVRNIRDTRNGSKVIFQKHAAIYYLKASQKNSAEILTALRSSLNQAEPISVDVDSNTLEIKALSTAGQ